MKGCQNDLHIPLFLVELLIWDGDLGFNAYTQMHTST